MFINFSDLPNQHNLFLDYLYEFENVKDFYKKNFRDNAIYNEIFNALSKKERPFRRELPEIVRKQYDRLIPSIQTISNIESLKAPTTFAIVTGQQLGIFGGPLYTFYKIITAIKLSTHLNDKYDNFQFVPVFWLEGDDHDFDEVCSINLVNDNNDVIQITYSDGLEAETNRGSIGNLKFNNNINSVLEQVNSLLRENEFKPEVIEKVVSFYKEGKTFKEAFKELLFNLFDEHGLIIFDPADAEVKKFLKPVYKQEIDEYREHSTENIKTSAALEENYHAQVKVRPINLFFTDNDGGRYLIEPVDNEFRLKGKRKRIAAEAMSGLIENEPQRFSPNVILRPICQDYLLPTAVYVGGPGEISYFAQVIPMYSKFGVVQPIVYPRSSVTIVEKNLEKIIEKYNLDLNDFFSESDNVAGKVIGSISEFDLEAEFIKSNEEVDLIVDRLKEKLFSIDKTLIDTAEKSKEKILKDISMLKDKALEAQKKKHEATLRQLSKASNIIFPNGNFQERELSIIYFLHKYGMDVMKRMFNEILINKFEHQILEL